MDGIQIVRPTLDDAEPMLRLRSALFAEELITSGCNPLRALDHTSCWTAPEQIENHTDVLADWLRSRRDFVRIVTQTGYTSSHIVGLFTGKFATPRRGINYISTIQLHPSVRRKGVGTQLMHEFFTAATANRPIELDVLEGNHPARAFYASLGFTQISRSRAVIGRGPTGFSAIATLRLRLRRAE